ncbi:hypothetical protein J7M28_03070 [bacterium]|nr:hypothetical protein [bacterium]
MKHKVFLVGILILVLLGLFRAVALTKVPCGCVGVRWSQFGGSGEGGSEVKLLMPGLHLNLPILHRIDIFSTRAKKLDIEHVQISLRDNISAYVDATVSFRVEPSKSALQFANGDGEQYVRRAMVNDLKGVVRDEFQKADAGEFLSASWRDAQTKAVEAKLLKSLSAQGITLLHFFLRDFAFTSSFERELKQQRLARQHTRRRALETRVSALEAESSADIQALKSQIDGAGEEAERQVRALNQEASLIADEARNKGEFLIERAGIDRQKLVNEALGSAKANALLRSELVTAIQPGPRFIVPKSSMLRVFDTLSEDPLRSRK